MPGYVFEGMHRKTAITMWLHHMWNTDQTNGGIRSAGGGRDSDPPDALLDPDAIALSYLSILRQPRSAWTCEIELRPWVERF